MNYKVLLYIAIGLVGVLSGCKKRSPLKPVEIINTTNGDALGANAISSSEIKLQELKGFRYLQGKAKVQYETNEQNLNLNVSFRIIENEAIWLSASPGLGIEAVRILISPKQIQIINKIERIAIVRDIAQAQALLKLPLDFYAIQALLLSNIPPSTQWYKEANEGINLNYLGLNEKSNGSIRYNLGVDSISQKLTTLSLQNGDKTQQSKISYSDYKTEGNFSLAQLIDVFTTFKSNPNKFDTVHIIWKTQKFEFPSEAPELPFEIPNSYDRQ